MSDAAVIQCQGLYKSFVDADLNVSVLNGVDLSVSAGRQIGIVGASGSGKSTLLHILGGLDRPSKGQVLLQERDIHALPAAAAGRLRNRLLGFVYQFHHLLPEFTALENVAMPLLISGMQATQAADQAEAMLRQVGLADRLKHKPAKLSGGERQRTAIARAMVTNPACILADEPTGNLDNRTAGQVYELMLGLTEASNVSFIVVTHDMELAARMDETFLLEGGVLQASA